MAGGTVIVQTKGLVETRALLKEFAPDLLKRLNVRVGLVARNLRDAADSAFSFTGVGGGAYRIKTRSRVNKVSVSVIAKAGGVSAGERWSDQPGVLASIFELANGVRDSQPQNVKRTQSLIATLNAKYGGPGRFLWSSWDDQKAASLASIDAEIRAVEAEYTERMSV